MSGEIRSEEELGERHEENWFVLLGLWLRKYVVKNIYQTYSLPSLNNSSTQQLPRISPSGAIFVDRNIREGIMKFVCFNEIYIFLIANSVLYYYYNNIYFF